VTARVAFLLVYLALAGALASWIVGAVFYLRTLRQVAARSERRQTWLVVVAWPFAISRLSGAAAANAAKVNRALVAFFACLMVAFAATAIATNLQRIEAAG
jgi:hypothetical protein